MTGRVRADVAATPVGAARGSLGQRVRADLVALGSFVACHVPEGALLRPGTGERIEAGAIAGQAVEAGDARRQLQDLLLQRRLHADAGVGLM